MNDESNAEALGETAVLLVKDESVAMGSLHSGGTLKQYPESGPPTRTQNEPLQEERIEVLMEGIQATGAAVGVFSFPAEREVFTMRQMVETDTEAGTDLHGEVQQASDSANMSESPSAHCLYREFNVRDILVHKYPDFQPILTSPVMESLDSTDRDKKLLAALQQGEFDIFRENLDSGNRNPSYDEPYSSSLLEIACQMENRQKFVESLLDNGADPNIKNRVTGMPLLHATARSGNFDVLEILLKRQHVDLGVRDIENRTILHWWARVSEINHGDNEGLERVFNSLLQWGFVRNVGIDCMDGWGLTSLGIAIACDHRDRVILLLGKGADVMACEHARPILESSSTSVLEDILDCCLESNNEPVNSEHLMVTLRYGTLERMLFLAEVPHQKDIFRHPVFSVFLSLIWRKTMRYFLFRVIVLYVMFLIFLTAFILYSESADAASHNSVSNNTNDMFSVNDSHVTSGMKNEKRHNTSQALWYILMFLLAYLFFGWLMQLISYCRIIMKNTTIWLELLLYIVTFTSCSGIVDSIEANRHLFAFSILLGWIELLLILRQIPTFWVQIHMLKTVSCTFLKYMAGYIILILAFAFSFYITFKENVQGDDVILFTNPFISILKTTVMFSGEFDASDLPFDRLPGTSHVIFLLFVFLIAIVLLNLLNGLAVGDTKQIRKTAETLSLVARARAISVNLHYSKRGRRALRLFQLRDEMFELYPNKPNQIVSSYLESLRGIITKKRNRSREVKSKENVENWLAKELTELRLQLKEIREILIKK